MHAGPPVMSERRCGKQALLRFSLNLVMEFIADLVFNALFPFILLLVRLMVIIPGKLAVAALEKLTGLHFDFSLNMRGVAILLFGLGYLSFICLIVYAVIKHGIS